MKNFPASARAAFAMIAFGAPARIAGVKLGMLDAKGDPVAG